jgi:hypothetical protein
MQLNARHGCIFSICDMGNASGTNKSTPSVAYIIIGYTIIPQFYFSHDISFHCILDIMYRYQ